MNRLVLLSSSAILLLMLAAPTAQSAEPEQDITGTYDCQGQDTDGTKYAGTVVIKKDKDTYLVSWRLGAFGNFVGVGIRDEKGLSVSWASGPLVGLITYRLKEEGKLEGRWAILRGPGTVQQETLTPKK